MGSAWRGQMQEDKHQSETSTQLSARINSSCFACGLDNPRGLHLNFEKSAHGEMCASWTPDQTTEGFDGIVHGGLVSTVLDESMAKAVTASGADALTVELLVRFRRHVIAGDAISVCGWVTESRKRKIRTEATLTNSHGEELAHGWASFLVLK